MSEMITKLSYYINNFPMVRYALIVGVLIALCSSLLGVTLVLRRFSFIGDGLSHVAFGAMAIAAALKIANAFTLVLPITILCAVLLLRAGQNTNIRGDAALAMLSVGTLAVGYLIINLYAKSANLSGDVCAALFGSTSILTLQPRDVWLCAILSVAVIAVFVVFYHKIFAVTFDESFAAATGSPVRRYNLLLAVIIAAVVVLAMNLVGSLLIAVFGGGGGGLCRAGHSAFYPHRNAGRRHHRRRADSGLWPVYRGRRCCKEVITDEETHCPVACPRSALCRRRLRGGG